MTTWDAKRLNHRLEGPEDAPVLVLSNSLGTAMAMWDDQAPALREEFRLLRYDARGHGASPAPPGPYEMADLGRDVLALLDALEIERASFCGLSVGGMTGMWLASEAPDRVERLVLLCTSAFLPPKSLWDERIETAGTEGMDALVDGILERWFTPGFRSRNPAAVEEVAAALRATDPEGYAGCCAAIRDMDLRDRLPSIQAPTLVVSAADDPATPPEHGRAIADSIPDARFEVVREASHLANIEQPGETTRLILGHLEPVLGGAVMPEDARGRGMEVRRQVLGDVYVDRAVERTTSFTADFQDLITRYAWGEIWTRPGLDRRTRSCITLTALMARGHMEELGIHVEGALRNGLTEEEIKEVLLQGAVYCGVPAANAAFAVAARVLEGSRTPPDTPEPG